MERVEDGGKNQVLNLKLGSNPRGFVSGNGESANVFADSARFLHVHTSTCIFIFQSYTQCAFTLWR